MITVRLATPSGTCRVCARRLVPLWVKSGKATCATCCAKGVAVGDAMAFGTESDKQEARRREKTPTG